jgi:hypothetical protein
MSYFLKSNQLEVNRAEIEIYLISLLALEMYLRDGESDNPIWWQALTPDDQTWLTSKRQTIYDHWKSRIENY